MPTATTIETARRVHAWTPGPEGVPIKPVVVHGSHILYGLQPRQLEAWKRTPLFSKPRGVHQPRHIGYGGAAGAAKSHFARAIAAGVALMWPKSVSLLLRRTLPELYRNHVVPLQEEIPESLAVYRERPISELRWRNGSRTVLGYLGSFADVTRYQGDPYDCMIFEESTHYEERSVNWLVSNRLRSSGALGSYPFAVYPTNPGDIGHFWYKRLFIDRKYRPDRKEDGADYTFVQAFLRDNQILLRRDPSYADRLERQPEPYRSWYRDGNWNMGAGVALPMLDREIHVVPAFEVPSHWPWFAAFDWGFAHPWVFGIYTVSEDGRCFKVDTLRGRRQNDGEIIRSIREVCQARSYPLDELVYVACGRDTFSKRGRDVAYDGPTLAERMIQAGFPAIEANNDRIPGLRQFREMLAWKDVLGPGEDDDPYLLFMDRPANLECLDTLERTILDPLRPEDALKVNADEFGEGGDDDYDECLTGDVLVETASGPVPIRDLVGTEGWLYSIDGLRPYHSVRMTRARAPVYRVTVEGGRSFRATASHPVLTAAGWKLVSNLSAYDAIRYVRCHGRPRGFGLRQAILQGADVYPHEAGLLQVPESLPAPRSVEGREGFDSAGPPCASSRWGPGEQQHFEPGSPRRGVAHRDHVDAEETTGRSRTYARATAEDPAEGARVSRFGSWSRDAQPDCEGDVGTPRGTDGELPALRIPVSDPGHAPNGEVLFEWLQIGRAASEREGSGDEGLRVLRSSVPGESIQADGDLFAEVCSEAARVVSVEPVGYAPVYNLEVPSTHAFAIEGGLIVHNCRYALSSRPPRSPQIAPDQELRAWDPEVLRREHEKLRRVKDLPTKTVSDEIRKYFGA